MAVKKHYGDDYYTYRELQNRGKKFSNSDKKRIDLFFPSPDVLEQYERLEEGFISKLLKMSESEQQHRHKQEQRALDAQMRHARLGKVSSIIITLVLMLLAYELIGHHHYKFATAFVAIAGALVLGSIISACSGKNNR